MNYFLYPLLLVGCPVSVRAEKSYAVRDLATKPHTSELEFNLRSEKALKYLQVSFHWLNSTLFFTLSL